MYCTVHTHSHSHTHYYSISNGIPFPLNRSVTFILFTFSCFTISLTPPSLSPSLSPLPSTHTHTHTLTHTGVCIECPPELIWRKTKFWSIQYVLQYLKQRSVALSLTHSHSLTHTNYSTVHVCTVYVHMVERTHTPDTHATHALNLQLQSLESGVPFHTLFVPYVSYHHTQHSPISSPFTSLRFQHTHRHVHYRTHTMYSNVIVEMYCTAHNARSLGTESVFLKLRVCFCRSLLEGGMLISRIVDDVCPHNTLNFPSHSLH